MSIAPNLPFRQSKGLSTKQKEKQEFKQSSSRILSYRTGSTSIQQLIQSNCQNNNFSSIQQLRVLHSQNLQSLKGIEVFAVSLNTANLSSNVISSIQGIQNLTKLQTLQLRNNRIQSLKGISKCANLRKLDVSNNLISSFDGLNDIGKESKLEKMCLAGNKFHDLNDLKWLSNCKKMKEIVFVKGKSTNPLCENYGDYIFVLDECLRPIKNYQNIIIDNLPLSEHVKELEESNHRFLSNVQNTENNVIEERLYSNADQSMEKQKPIGIFSTQNVLKKQSNLIHTHSLSPQFHRTQSQQNQLLLTQNQLYHQQTQQILGLKNQHIQDLKFKNSQLQVQKSTQFKQLLKKETQVQRLQGQNKQLHKQLQKKEKSLAEMHRRVQEMLKSSTQRNNVIESKNAEIQKLRQELNDTKIQSAEYKALVKDYERRLSQLHEKTLSTIQERTLKQDEMKRKNEELYDENYRLQKEKQEMKDRMRELTELLREWEFKYQSKINEIQARHAIQRQDLLKQAQQKISSTVHNYQHELQRVDDEMRHRVEQIEIAYKSSLEEAYEKQKKLKSAYEERTKSQQQMKVFLKSAFDKNQQQDSLIHEFQQIVIKLKGQLTNVYDEKEHLAKQNGQLKYKAAQQMSSLEQKLSKATYDKSRMEKELMDLKETHSALIHDNESQIKYQKLYEQLEAKFEDLQASFDVKTQLLEDKNDTIESLKQQIEALQRQGAEKVDLKEFQSIRKKYEKYKKQCQQFSEQTSVVLQENQDLKRENEDLRKENDDCKEIAIEFEKMKDTLTGYERSVQQKDSQLQQLMKYVEECKRVIEACKQEVDQQRRQCDRIEKEARNRERQLKDELRDIEMKNKKQIQLMKVENEKYRKNALEQLQSVFLKLQK